MRFVRYLVLLLVALAAVAVVCAQAAPASGPGVYSILTDREPMLSLAGDWRFHIGDDPRFAQPSYNDADWQLLRSDQPWGDQGFANVSGFAWYRFKVVVPATQDEYSMVLPKIWTAYEVFVDGVKVGGFGKAGERSFYYPVERMFALPAGDRTRPQTYAIALRVWEDPAFLRTVPGGPMAESAAVERVGRTSALRAFLARQDVLAHFARVSGLILSGLSLFAAVLSFVLFAIRRTEREYLYFGLATLFSSIQSGIDYAQIGHAWSLNAVEMTTTTAAVAAEIALLLFYRRLLNARITWTVYFVGTCSLLQLLPTVLLMSARTMSVGAANALTLALSAPFEIWVIALLVRRALAGVTNALLLLIPALMLFVFSSLDTLLVILEDAGYKTNFHVDDFALQTPIPVQPHVLATFFFLLAMLAALITRFAATARKQDRVDSELEAARQVQQVLIPDVPPVTPGLGIATAYYPAQEVGGDFFQILQLPEGETLVVLGDVSGKGVAAAMTVSLAIGALRTLAEFTGAPGKLLQGLNRRLYGRGTGFTTCVALRINRDGRVRMANAGHLQPYLNGREMATEPALPLGLIQDAEYEERVFQLTPGDRLTLMTDGVVEAQCKNELFGFARTESVSMEPAATIAQTAIRFGQTDDITVLSIYFAEKAHA